MQHRRNVFEVDEGTGTNEFIAAAANLDEDIASSSPESTSNEEDHATTYCEPTKWTHQQASKMKACRCQMLIVIVFCLKTKVAINLQHCRSKNKKQSGSQNEGVEC